MRFAHIADTHIRNLKYHKEYREVFSKLYESLKEQKVDYIVHCGDIAHTKTQISPEFVDLCSDFLKNLADIAPTYVILGNHDGNLRNSSRQDALTPIANALGHSNLYLLKESGEVQIDNLFTLNVLSVFDRENWRQPTDYKKINIALYHGSISNCKTDLGWVMERGEDDIGIFNSFDYGFLGDIHKTNQSLDKKGKIRYPGSTVQQNHGETNDKGYLVWDIQDKENYTCTHHVLRNPKPFITIKLTPKGRIPNKTEINPSARLRLISENNLPLDVVRKAVDVAKKRFSPETVIYLNRGDANVIDGSYFTKSLGGEDLRDVAVQEDLIKEYLKEYQVEDENLQKIYDLNKRYNSLLEEQEEVRRNINWKLKRVEWDNLFNYGENNCVEFTNLNGIVGIFGKNYSGKSSIIDSLLYTLFNTTSKNNRKNLNIINQNKDDCRGYVEIDIGAKTYKVERTSKKYEKSLKGKKTKEAKTDVDFTVIDNATGVERELNGLSRLDTDKNIKKVFGTLEDFLLTSMASQLGSLSYISEGSTKRKEILAKFLDLEIFEYKFKKSKEEASEARTILKRSEERDFDQEIKDARAKFARNDTTKDVKERECTEVKAQIEELVTKHSDLDIKIKSLPTEIIDIKKVTSNLKSDKEAYSGLEAFSKEQEKELQEIKSLYKKIDLFLSDFDVSSLEEKQRLINEKSSELEEIQSEIEKHEDDLNRQKKKIQLLKEVPCGEEYSHCKFIKDAYSARKKIANVLVTVEDLSLSRKDKENMINNLQPDTTNEHIRKYEKILEKKSSTQNEISALELTIEKIKTKKLKLKNNIDVNKKKKEEYEKNKEAIENFESLEREREDIEKKIVSLKERLSSCQKKLMDLYKVNGSLEEKLQKIQDEKDEHETIRTEYAAHDLFLRCMHPNGISYDIIKRRLPIINNEVSKILANIVDFEIFFENEENKLDILIKHPGYDPRPIEMGSGAEKTIAAMSIRLALLNVSTLPKGDVFILDEPGTALDEENMEGFTRILDMIKTQFKTVMLISHLDSLKDIVDQQVVIEKNNGYAYVNQ